MEEVVAPLPIITTQKSELVLSLEIKQNEEKYIFKIIKEEHQIILNMTPYHPKYLLMEIK